MDFVAQPPELLVRPWRRATVIASAIAVVELVLLLLAGLVLIGRPLSKQVHAAAVRQAKSTPAHHQAAAYTPPVVAAKAPVVARLTRSQTSLLVLNGNGRAGAAGAEATLATARGYKIAGVGNAARGDYSHTIVMYRPGYEPEARRLAKDLNVQIVAPLDGLRVKALHGGQLAVVVGAS